jgi:hypothetical protein
MAVVPALDRVSPPGDAVTVQLPIGSPLKATEPVEVLHVGWVIAPVRGGVGE